jgi:hypothetical protein
LILRAPGSIWSVGVLTDILRTSFQRRILRRVFLVLLVRIELARIFVAKIEV